MKHYYLTLTATLLLTTAALAQTFKPVSHWRAGGSGGDAIADIAIDTAGNQYICGDFSGTVDVDPGPGVYNLTMPTGQTQRDAFLMKLDPSGNFLWAKSFGGNTDQIREATRVFIDNGGNVYVIGIYKGDIKFEPNATSWPTNGNPYSAFLVKFSPAGTLLWGYGWNTTASLGFGDIAFDDFNRVYVTGSFSGTLDVNPLPGAGNVNAKTSSGDLDMLLLVFDQNGAFKKVKTNGGAGGDMYFTIEKYGQNKLFIGGNFSGTVDMNFGPGISNLTSINARDGFIMQLDTALNFKWAKSYGGQGNIWCRGTIVNDSMIYNLGVFEQSADFNPSSSNSATLVSNGNYDCYLQALDTGGNYVWAVSFGGTGKEEARGFSQSSNGEFLMSSYFENTVDFDPSPNSSQILSSKGGRDGYILKLDAMGGFLNAASYGSSAISEGIYSVNSDYLNFDLAGGNFFNTIDINPSSLVTQNVTSAGQDDMLYLKLESCTNALVQSTATACGNSYQLPSGTVVTQSGYYLDTVLSTQGCDSTNGITVTLNPLPNTTVTQTGATFTAQPGLTYQWFNCQTNQPIAGETNQTFTATANGQYAVLVSNGTCTDTSVCYSITNIGLHEAHLPAVSMYPNPTTGLLNISSPQPWQKAEVTDLLGRQLGPPQTPPKEGLTSGYTAAIDLSHLPTGIYLVKVFFTEGVVVQRVVKR